MGLHLICFTPGTRSNAGYTYPEMGAKYVGSKKILASILDYERQSPQGLNGFILLLHTARILGTKNLKTDFFLVVRELHTHLLLGKAGGEIIRWNELIFLVLCISGLVFWWPRQKKFFRQASRINFKTKNWKRFNWDLHSVLGFYGVLSC